MSTSNTYTYTPPGLRISATYPACTGSPEAIDIEINTYDIAIDQIFQIIAALAAPNRIPLQLPETHPLASDELPTAASRQN